VLWYNQAGEPFLSGGVILMLVTQRLTIRRFTPQDGPDLYEYLSDPQVVRYEPYDVFSMEASQKEAESRAYDDAFWAVCLNDSKKLIGNIYLNKLEFDTWELGYVFNAAYQGKGYAFESAGALIQYIISEQNARRIVAYCNPENEKSWRLMERLGMRREGHLIQSVYHKKDENGNPVWHDTYEYAVLKPEWHHK
jgi:RimJ/RimL family protein N-acetyltransferase